ncbi:AP2 domain transcription factor AP2XII-2 [Toxoplasma gondii VAND]|uniref:AP2 domain transcription factor AP2XII-2 n=1 Tax=Toxoplasma gondii VAND TaxID=933077 RepID=A0A086PY52_TOXGO|nr:AP2 domain transcription factor AP2XII-2 [Toxoplasma gondii VAND]
MALSHLSRWMFVHEPFGAPAMARSSLDLPVPCPSEDSGGALPSRLAESLSGHCQASDGPAKTFPANEMSQTGSIGSHTESSFDFVGTEDSVTGDHELPGPRVSSPSRCTTTASVAFLPAFPVSAESTLSGSGTGETGKLQDLAQAKTENGKIPTDATTGNELLSALTEKVSIRDEDTTTEAQARQAAESFFPASRDPLAYPEASRASLLRETPGIASFARPLTDHGVNHSTALSAVSLSPSRSPLNPTQPQENPASSCFPGGAGGVPGSAPGAGNRGVVSTETLQRLISNSPLHIQALLASMRQQRDGQLGETARVLSRQLWAAAARASPVVIQQQLRLRSQLLARLALERRNRGQPRPGSTPAPGQAKSTSVLEPAQDESRRDSARKPVTAPPKLHDLNHEQAQRLRQAEAQLERPEVFTVLHNGSAAILHFVLRALGLLANACPQWSGSSPFDSVAPSHLGPKAGSKQAESRSGNSAFSGSTLCLGAGSLESKMREEFGLDAGGAVSGEAGCAGHSGMQLSGTAEADRPVPSSSRWHWLHVVSFADKPELLTIYHSILAPLLSLVPPSVLRSGRRDASVSPGLEPKASATSYNPSPGSAAASEQSDKERCDLCGVNSAFVLLQVLRDLDDLRSLHDPVFLPSGMTPLQLLGKPAGGFSAQLTGTGDANPQDGACGEGCRCTANSDSLCGLAVLRRSPFFPSFVEAAKGLLAWPASGAAVAAACLSQGMFGTKDNQVTLERCSGGKVNLPAVPRAPLPTSHTGGCRATDAPSQGSTVNSAVSREEANQNSLVATARGLAECVLKHVDLNSLDGADLLTLLRLSEHLKPSLEEASPALGGAPAPIDKVAETSENSFGCVNFEEVETGQGAGNSANAAGLPKTNAFGDVRLFVESGKVQPQERALAGGRRGHTETNASEIAGVGSQAIGEVSDEATQEAFPLSTDLRRHSRSITGSSQPLDAHSSKATSSLRFAPMLDSLVNLPEMCGSESPTVELEQGCGQLQEQPPHALLRFSPLFTGGLGVPSDLENPTSGPSLTGAVGAHDIPAPVSPVERLLPGAGGMFGLQETLPESPAACSLGALLCPGGVVNEASDNLLTTDGGRGCFADSSSREAAAFESLYPSTTSSGYSFSRLPSQEADVLPSELVATVGFPTTSQEGSPLPAGSAARGGLGRECDLSAFAGRPEGSLRQANAVGGLRAVAEAGPGRRGVRHHAAGSRLPEKRPGKHASRTPGPDPLLETLSKKDYGLPAGASCDESAVGSSLTTELQGGVVSASCGIGGRNKRTRAQEPAIEGDLSGNRDRVWSDIPEGVESLPDLLSRGVGSLAPVASAPSTSPCKVKPTRAAGGSAARRPAAVATSRGLAVSTSSSVRSAVKGIYFDSYKKLWRVQWNRSGSSGGGGSGGAGRRVSRSFSCARLGFEAAKARAVAWMLSGGLVGDGGLPSGDSRLGVAGNGTGNAEGLSDRSDGGALAGASMTPELLIKEEKERLLFADPRLFLERIEAFYIRHRLYGLQCNGSGAGGSQNGSEDGMIGAGESGSTGNKRGNGGSGGLRIVSVLSLDDMLAVLNGTKHGMGEQDTSEPLEEREEEANEDRSRTVNEEALCGAGPRESPPLSVTVTVPQSQTERLMSRKKLKREKGASATEAVDRPAVRSSLPVPFVSGLSEEMEKHLFRLLPSLTPVQNRLDLGMQACHTASGEAGSLAEALAAELSAAGTTVSSRIVPEEHEAHVPSVSPLSG